MPRRATEVDPPSPDLRYTQTWGIEDSTNGVAGLIVAGVKTAQKEAFKLCEYRNAPVTIYWIDGRAWRVYAVVKP
jgi:hypothetical protein